LREKFSKKLYTDTKTKSSRFFFLYTIFLNLLSSLHHKKMKKQGHEQSSRTDGGSRCHILRSCPFLETKRGKWIGIEVAGFFYENIKTKRGVLMIKGRTIFVLLLCVIVYAAVGSAGCKKSTEAKAEPVCVLSGHTECKGTQETGAGRRNGALATQAGDCIQYQYNGSGTLILTHVNAAFNCCPGKIEATFYTIGHEIEITEVESAAGCYCRCLYDLNYELKDLEPGVYTIRFIEPYRDESDELLEFSLDLSSSGSGEHCVDRTTYPWVL
jgi:hypothetical protein